MFYINTSITTQERYAMAKFIQNLNNDWDILNSYFLTELLNLEPNGTYSVQADENMADLISYNIYKDTQYWFVICQYNAILDPNNILSGTTLKYPSLADLEELYFSLKGLSI